jgi:hypothetical protein
MSTRRAQFKVTSGPNSGDIVSVELGCCRLIGRHLSETETSFIDREGNRILEANAATILTDHLQERSPQPTQMAQTSEFSSTAYERGTDIIFSDDSISRAHAMLFFDDSGAGVIDLASTNGTYVNNERISSALVKDGDSVGLGGSQMKVRVRG